MKKLLLISLCLLAGCNVPPRATTPTPAKALAPIPTPINVLSFGAVGDNSTDDTAAIQSAINQAMATNGGGATVLFPAGRTFLCSSKLILDIAKSVVLQGQAAPEGVGLTTAASTLNFSQGGTDSLISARASQGCTFQNLRMMNTNALFTGYFLDLSGNVSDTSGASVLHCHFQGASRAVGNASYGIFLGQALTSTIGWNQFSFMQSAILGVNMKGYSNSHLIINNQFNNLSGAAAIVNAGQMWTIIANTFEASQTSQPCGYMDQKGYGAYGPVCFNGNWFGDSQTQGAPWIQYGGNGLSCVNNYFKVTGSTASCVGLGSTTQALQGALFTGNSFEGAFATATTGAASIFGYAMICNHITGAPKSDPLNLLYNPVILGNDTSDNYFSTPLTFGNFAKVGPLAAMPGGVPYASMGTISPGVPNFLNGELAFVSRGDGGGTDHGIVIAGGDFVNGLQIPLARFQRSAGVQIYRPLVLSPVASTIKNSFYVDPSTGVLTWIDKNGKLHPIATP